jgi:hypothetical protein
MSCGFATVKQKLEIMSVVLVCCYHECRKVFRKFCNGLYDWWKKNVKLKIKYKVFSLHIQDLFMHEYVKSSRVWWVGHVTCIDVRNVYKTT